ncbi:MAG: ribosome maturation factor RimM [Alistipes sp.]
MLIPAARASRLFGTDGGLMLTLYAAFPSEFSLDIPLFARIDMLDVPLYCDQFERRGVTGAVVHFADIDTERRATELLSKELYINLREDNQEEDDEFYMEDLVGFHAEAKGLAGEVTDYIDSEINPLFEVTTAEGNAVLIPAAEEFVAKIDFEKRRIKFVLPEGLIDLNAK